MWNRYDARNILSFVLCFAFTFLNAQKNHLKTEISLSIEEEKISEVLKDIEMQTSCLFSYNSTIINSDSIISINVENKSVKSTLDLLFEEKVKYKTLGNHIIMYNNNYSDEKMKQNENKKYQISGRIIDKFSGEVISRVSIYDVQGRYTTLTTLSGKFTLEVPANNELRSLNLSKKGYRDTIIIVKPIEENYVNLKLEPLEPPIKTVNAKSSEINVEHIINQKAIVEFMVSEDVLTHANNMRGLHVRKISQISFLPFAGTHLSSSGLYVNNLSLNVLAGYSGGVEGIEVAGLLNINRLNVKGLQLAGIGNINGGNVYGTQYGGVFNYNGGHFQGIQFGGVINTTLHGFKGIQLSGTFNYTGDSLTGIQYAGVANVHNGIFNGIQIAGVTNYIHDTLKGIQFAGVYNHSNKISYGAQFSGVSNNNFGKLYGIQMAGITNYSDTVFGIQAAGINNIVKSNNIGIQISGLSNLNFGNSSGIQISPFYNYAKNQKGLQLGLINISDSIKGISLGLFTYAKSGFHKFQLSYNENFLANIEFKTGASYFHNIYKLSMVNSKNQSFMWALGFGFGSNIKIYKKLGIGLDLVSNYVIEQKQWINSVNQLNRLSFNMDYSFAKHFTLYAGPALNLHISNLTNPLNGEFTSQIPKRPFYSTSFNNFQAKMWWGFNIGMRF